MRSSGQTDGHRKTAYQIESKHKLPTILKNKSELLQSQFLRVKSRQREKRNKVQYLKEETVAILFLIKL